ncbi:hypothetical protein H7F51_00530 [Novosphingobium flavum]|uniref:Uncharacterized protein n=1 Tax=Novosphingobium flavum TaxID=1778672 RepID=A0A7X1FNC2_9SPHN|nr:hypothetical protein [Novosphingobium flavum]MBC2663994.1 hypothetical protein [Novosphingobium flavum]
MEFLFELIFQLFGELLIQLLFEAAAELGLRLVAAPITRPRHPLFASLGFNLWGAIAGGISLLVLPKSQITNPDFRIAAVFVVPFVMGFVMLQVGKLRARRGQGLVGLDHFWNGFAFAFAMALVRYLFAH